jgi:hypothetical protein
MFSGLKIIVFYLFNPYRLISSIVRPVATIIPENPGRYVYLHKDCNIISISHYDTLKDDLLTLDEVILGRISHT